MARGKARSSSRDERGGEGNGRAQEHIRAGGGTRGARRSRGGKGQGGRGRLPEAGGGAASNKPGPPSKWGESCARRGRRRSDASRPRPSSCRRRPCRRRPCRRYHRGPTRAAQQGDRPHAKGACSHRRRRSRRRRRHPLSKGRPAAPSAAAPAGHDGRTRRGIPLGGRCSTRRGPLPYQRAGVGQAPQAGVDQNRAGDGNGRGGVDGGGGGQGEGGEEAGRPHGVLSAAVGGAVVTRAAPPSPFTSPAIPCYQQPCTLGPSIRGVL